MGKSPDLPAMPPPAPPAPDAFDQQVRSARAAARDQELRAKGRRSTLIAGAAAKGAAPTVGGKTLLGQ